MIAVATFVGCENSISEDAVLVGDRVIVNDGIVTDIPAKGFVCIADGVGGNNAGEVASTSVLEMLRSYNGSEDLKSFLCCVNKKLLEKSNDCADFNRMATTLTGIWMGEGSESWLVHVGNTRAYLMQGHYLKQLTEDHTMFHYLTASGRKEEAEHCNRSAITNCFGGGDPRLLSRLSVIPLSIYHRLLLTSDGVHEYVDIDTMETIMNAEASDLEKVDSLIQTAKERGSMDDASAVIVER